MANIKDKCFCKTCKQTLAGSEFYTSKRLDKYPNGKLDQCKKCVTMFVDNWDPKTFLWILEEIDLPWVSKEWYKLLADAGREQTKITGLTIIGKYIAKMRLKQYKEYGWKDSELLQKLEEAKTKEALAAQGKTPAEIAEILQQNAVPLVAPPRPDFDSMDLGDIRSGNAAAPPQQTDYFQQQLAVDVPKLDLTNEDRTYLFLKWGKYTPEEWVKLEQLYEEMMSSYDIQGAGHIDTLKLICKTSLKANQLIDIGDKNFYVPI